MSLIEDISSGSSITSESKPFRSVFLHFNPSLTQARAGNEILLGANMGQHKREGGAIESEYRVIDQMDDRNDSGIVDDDDDDDDEETEEEEYEVFSLSRSAAINSSLHVQLRRMYLTAARCEN